MGSVLQGLFPLKLMRKCTPSPTPFSALESTQDFTRPIGQKGVRHEEYARQHNCLRP